MGHQRSAATTMTMEDVSFDFEADIDAKDALRKASLKAEGKTSAESAATRGRHSIVCKHWLRHLCMKGDKCDFLHQYDPERMPECVFWLKYGKCNDPECIFKHVAPSERPECQRYRLGFCRYGPMCRSRHDRLPRQALPEILPDWFLSALLLNAHLVPRAEDVRLAVSNVGNDRQLALPGSMSAPPETEQGTIPGLPPPIHGKCRYYIVRSMNVRNIQISAAKGVWATSPGNTMRLRQAFRDVDHVIVIFSTTESRSFSGYGKMLCEPDDRLLPGVWGDMTCRFGSNFRVHWIKQCNAPLGQADHIKNPQNDDLPVRRCRDGQELPSSVGERLCRFLWQESTYDLLRGSELEFEPRVDPWEPPPAIKENGEPGAPKGAGEAPANGATPLALEDAKKDGNRDQDDGGSRPAPTPLGTFQQEGPQWKQQALASGSSSLLAAMAEDTHFRGQPPAPAGWPPPLPAPGWGPGVPPRLPPPGPWAAPPRYMPPPAYYPPTYGPPLLPHLAARPYWEARPPPPGFWADQRGHSTQPPTSWEGAAGGDAARREERGHSRGRSRSRDRRRHKHRK